MPQPTHLRLVPEDGTNPVPFCFEQFFHENYARVVYFASQILHSLPLAEDIVASSFLKLHERIGQLRHSQAATSYLYKTVRMGCLEYLRNEKIHQRKLRSEVKPDPVEERTVLHAMIESETLHALLQSIETLPDQCGRVIRMLYLEGMEYEEIARALGISVNTVRNHRARGVQLLRRRLSHLPPWVIFYFFFR
ncbi:MAG TPA: sigma-70 family RNA polymerase sigma factor [Chitinophagaceae bacterium]|nr:sigma-70 family RNA polymerase sigma factor [Chitinophagaceae bacterium]